MEWSKRYGTTRSPQGAAYVGNSVVQTKDSGFAVVSTSDFGTGNEADQRFWLVKTDQTGNAEWNKTYGEQRECACSIVQTVDGGYAMVGNSVIGGYGNAWLVKTDSSGSMLWNKSYTEIGWATANTLIQTNDGGYVIAGCKEYYDGWLMKTDVNGTMQWSRSFVEINNTHLQSVVQTNDGGYVAAGATQWPLFSGKVDAYVVKTDADGNTTWSKQFSRTAGNDYGRSIVQARDGGYAIAGETDHWGNADFWLIKIDASGNFLWDRTYGGTGWDGANSIVQTSDGGYALAGQTNSFGAGGNDFWLVKTDAEGNMQWNQTFGGAGDDGTGAVGSSIVQTRDGGYALTGYTNSFSSDGSYQVWLIKLAAEDVTPPAIDILSPQNATYNVTPVSLSFTVNESTSWMGYSLDNQSNVTISGNATLAGISVGQHSIIVYANDTSGNMGSSQVVDFTIVQPRTIIVPDDHPTIQEAINAASDGDTVFVRNGTYYEHVIVNKTLSLIGESRVSTFVDGSNNGYVVNVMADNVSISQFTLQNAGSSWSGANVEGAAGVLIQDNDIIDNHGGVWVRPGSLNTTISGNRIFNKQPSYADGIRLWSSGTLVVGNIITNESSAIGPDAAGNTIRDNLIANNSRNRQ
jgi:hypothetical protein